MIVSVDCGIRAIEAADRARDLGVDLIITDHHEPEPTLPSRARRDQSEARRLRVSRQDLAGVGVALKLVQACSSRAAAALDLLPHFVKVAAIGTLADVVPLIGENRVIARCGLEGLSRGPHTAGLEALLEEAG